MDEQRRTAFVQLNTRIPADLGVEIDAFIRSVNELRSKEERLPRTRIMEAILRDALEDARPLLERLRSEAT